MNNMRYAMNALTQPLFFMPLLLAAGTFCYLYMLRRQQLATQKKLRKLCTRVEKALADPVTTADPEQGDFSRLLQQAAGQTGFEQPRLRLQAGVSGDIPEKYQYFKTLQKKGIPVEEIAEILNISIAEARQLASLRMIAGRGKAA